MKRLMMSSNRFSSSSVSSGKLGANGFGWRGDSDFAGASAGKRTTSASVTKEEVIPSTASESKSAQANATLGCLLINSCSQEHLSEHFPTRLRRHRFPGVAIIAVQVFDPGGQCLQKRRQITILPFLRIRP